MSEFLSSKDNKKIKEIRFNQSRINSKGVNKV